MTWTLGDVISGAALLLSLIATYTSWRSNKEQKQFMETQERLNRVLLERETHEAAHDKSADLGASFLKLGRSSYRLKIYNKGKAIARNVRIEFPDGNSLISQDDIDAKFPFEIFDVHQSVELIAAIALESKPKLAVKLLWDDDSRVDNQKLIYPTF